jgi:hypothetical protein
VFPELFAHDVAERGGEGVEIAIDAPAADSIHLPRDRGAEQTEDHAQDECVPERQACAQRKRLHQASASGTS